MTSLRLATRRSALALAQSGQVAERVRAANPGLAVELVHVVTEGDRIQDRPLASIGGKGLFVKEIEAALLEGRADFAVHSMKDLPGLLPDALEVVCVPRRESPWDLLLSPGGSSLDGLPRGARIGTSSQRRALQLLALRPDLRVGMLRGNIDTRLRRLNEGDFDAIVLAAAGVARLGMSVTGVTLDGVMVPAVAQGALALEARRGDARVAAALAPLHDAATAVETAAERAVMIALEGSCVTPMGALARLQDGGARLSLEGFLARDDGSAHARASLNERFDGSVAGASELGAALARRLRHALSGGV